MLYKKELSTIPVDKMPEIKDAAKREFVATAQVVELKRSGKILVVDFFNRKEKRLTHRFCTDGKNYQTQSLWSGGAWTEQNPRTHIGYYAADDRPEDVNIARDYMHIKKPYRNSLLSIVDEFITDQRYERREKATARKEDLRKAHFAMYPPLPDNLTSYCENHLFTPYIFISALDKKGRRHSRCSHCNAEFEAPKSVRSGQPTSCPVCGRSAVYRATWIKTPIEDKSKICIAAKVDGQILLRWTNVARCFSHPYSQANYYFDDYAYNLHLHGGKTYFYKWMICGYFYGQWDWYRHVGALCDDTAAVYTDNLAEVFGERYCGVDLKETLAKTGSAIPFAVLLDNLKNIPATEYLLKLGMVNLAAKVRSIPGAMACDRPSFTGVLGVDGQLKKLYSDANVTLGEHNIIKSCGQYVSRELLDKYREIGIPSYDSSEVANLLKQMSFSKFVHYFHKQKRLNPGESVGRILICYRDYLSMSQGLGVDLSHKGIRFPKNCVEAHNQILPRFNAVKQEAEDNLFVRAVESVYAALRLTAFEKDGFCIVLPQKRSDLTTEGQSLNHCVGGQSYANNHMAGRRLIFFVREISNRSKPFFTMEVDMADYHICQLYGFGDCSAPPEVRKFAEAFVKKLASAKVTRKIA